MKKLLLIFVFLCVFALSACGGPTGPSEEPNDPGLGEMPENDDGSTGQSDSSDFDPTLYDGSLYLNGELIGTYPIKIADLREVGLYAYVGGSDNLVDPETMEDDSFRNLFLGVYDPETQKISINNNWDGVRGSNLSYPSASRIDDLVFGQVNIEPRKADDRDYYLSFYPWTQEQLSELTLDDVISAFGPPLESTDTLYEYYYDGYMLQFQSSGGSAGKVIRMAFYDYHVYPDNADKYPGQ